MPYRAIIISLKPEWWKKIREGEKLLEIRKTRPRGNGPYTVLIYVTGGVGVVGEFICDCFYKLETVPEIGPWALPPKESGTPYNLEKASCLTKEQLKEYAGDGGKPLWGWHIAQIKEYAKAISLLEVGAKKAPQSWCYIGGYFHANSDGWD